jgi:hypothetical protein
MLLLDPKIVFSVYYRNSPLYTNVIHVILSCQYNPLEKEKALPGGSGGCPEAGKPAPERISSWAAKQP